MAIISRAAVVCALTTALGAASVLAEEQSSGAVVERYLDGDHSGALIELKASEPLRLTRAVDASVAEIAAQAETPALRDLRLMAGALLHSERAAADIQLGQSESGGNHVGMAWAYLRQLEALTSHAAPQPQISSFCRRWYRFTSQQTLRMLDVDRTRELLQDGLRHYPGDAGLLLMQGSVEETAAMFGEPGTQTTLGLTRPPESMRRRAERQRLLEKAEKLYTRALAADPALAEARLRRGRTLQLLGRTAEAETDLAWVASEGREPRVFYLTHLFRSRLQEQRGDLRAAAQSCRAAAATGQRAQAAHLGLAHVLDLLGDRAGAAQAVDRATARPTQPDPLDPWWRYAFAQPLEPEALIAELRKEVHR